MHKATTVLSLSPSLYLTHTHTHTYISLQFFFFWLYFTAVWVVACPRWRYGVSAPCAAYGRYVFLCSPTPPFSIYLTLLFLCFLPPLIYFSLLSIAVLRKTLAVEGSDAQMEDQRAKRRTQAQQKREELMESTIQGLLGRQLAKKTGEDEERKAWRGLVKEKERETP